MTTKTIIELVSDISGEPIGPDSGRTINFSYDGVSYQVDLTSAEIATLERALQPYREAGRRVGGRRRVGSTDTAVERLVDLAAVRAWAASNGITVSPRGRIKAEILDQYRAAGN